MTQWTYRAIDIAKCQITKTLPAHVIARTPTSQWLVAVSAAGEKAPVRWSLTKKHAHVQIPLSRYAIAQVGDPDHASGFAMVLVARIGFELMIDALSQLKYEPIHVVIIYGNKIEHGTDDKGQPALIVYLGFAIQTVS